MRFLAPFVGGVGSELFFIVEPQKWKIYYRHIKNQISHNASLSTVVSFKFSSTMADACMNAYVPFVQSNCNTIYADSALAKVADIVTGMVGEQ